MTGLTPLVVGHGIRTGIRIATDHPASLGSDLVVDAVAATEEYSGTIAIFDMGTATTCSVVDVYKRQVDMPFMSYQGSVYDALKNAGRLMKEGRANAVKLEGGVEVVPQIQAIVQAGIPVMGHLGLTPQSINAFGGYKVQGKDEAAAQKLLDDAKAIAEAGVRCV